jgi:hypothetical protein
MTVVVFRFELIKPRLSVLQRTIEVAIPEQSKHAPKLTNVSPDFCPEGNFMTYSVSLSKHNCKATISWKSIVSVALLEE